jgi:hypothetical protein
MKNLAANSKTVRVERSEAQLREVETPETHLFASLRLRACGTTLSANGYSWTSSKHRSAVFTTSSAQNHA